ncbi:MAG TPA: glutamine synthetase family protein [Chloroflexota bacterium]|jgi:glutamine synthetase
MALTDSPASEALARVRTAGADFVYLQFTDILGSVKGVTIPASRLERAFDEGVWFDGSSVEGWARVAESDLYLRPDPSSLALFPWEDPPAARFICDLGLPSGEPFSGDPRQALKRVLAEANEAGFDYRVAAEFEFFLFLDEQSTSLGLARGLEPSDAESYYSMPTERTLRLCHEVARTLEQCGFAVAATHHEVSPGQHEIDLAEHDALRAADAIATLKIALRAYGQREKLLATFMPKPLAGLSGSGLHFQQALFDRSSGRNAFFEPDATYHLSDTGRAFVAGQLAHARGMCALMAPLVNSYKRLTGGGEAPAVIDWARINRGALIRVPELGLDGQRMFVELRSPDPSCNPYLALAVALKAGLEGIAGGTLLPEPVEERIEDEAAAAEQEADPLPQTLGEAIEELEWDPVVRAALGQSIYERFLGAKEQEWAAYRNHISLWEIESYLQRA